MFGPLQAGRPCVLCIGNRFFDTEVLATNEKAVRIRRPDEPLPADTAAALLAFHTDEGICSYYTQLIPLPDEDEADLVVWRTASLERQEMRSVLRVPADSEVTMRDDIRKVNFHGTLENISGGGARIATTTLIAPGTDLWLAMELPERDTVHARGRVAHVSEAEEEDLYYLGIKFTQIQPEGMNALRWFITSRLRELLPLGP